MRRAMTGLACVVLSTGIVATATQAVKIDFEKDEVAKAPRAFSCGSTGQGKVGVWVVRKDDAAHGNVVVQTDSDRTDYRLPLAVYHDVNGRRVAFQNKNVKVATNTWHTLKVVAAGDHFVVTYDGTAVLDAKDSTFADAGKVGLWTKADSVMAFDDLTIVGR